MDLLFLIAFFALIVGVFAYTVTTHYSSSRLVDGWVMIVAVVLSIPLLGLGIYAILDGGTSSETKMWAMGTCGIIAGFWFKNPWRDFNEA